MVSLSYRISAFQNEFGNNDLLLLRCLVIGVDCKSWQGGFLSTWVVEISPPTGAESLDVDFNYLKGGRSTEEGTSTSSCKIRYLQTISFHKVRAFGDSIENGKSISAPRNLPLHHLV